MTEMVDLLMFKKIAIKFQKFFSGPVTSFQLFLVFFSKKRPYISTLPVILRNSFMKFCVARTFLGHHHLDDVLEVLLAVGLKFYFFI